MPMYDFQCPQCRTIEEHLAYIGTTEWECGECGSEMTRVWTGHAAYVVSDGIPGGVMINHGLCNSDGSPRRYDSKSDIRREAKARGLENHVTHQPPRGTDRSKHTQRFV